VKDGGEVAVRHLFAAVLEDPGPVVSAVLAGAGISPERLREKLLSERELELEPIPVREEAGDQPVVPEPLSSSETPLLDRYGRDITRAAREGRLLPFVDSDRTRKTLRQLIKVLMMPTKNNPILVGEAGSGRPPSSRRWRSGSPSGGTVGSSPDGGWSSCRWRRWWRGRNTGRIRGAPDPGDRRGPVAPGGDPVHRRIPHGGGAGRAEGAPMDAGNIMKPALARGELRCIGATTITEYRRSVEKDPALERRFQPVQVAEPGGTRRSRSCRGSGRTGRATSA